MRTTLTLDARDAARSQRVLCPLPRAFAGAEGSASAAAFASAADASARCSALIPEIADSQAAKSSDLIEALLDPNQSNPNQQITL